MCGGLSHLARCREMKGSARAAASSPRCRNRSPFERAAADCRSSGRTALSPGDLGAGHPVDFARRSDPLPLGRGGSLGGPQDAPGCELRLARRSRATRELTVALEGLHAALPVSLSVCLGGDSPHETCEPPPALFVFGCFWGGVERAPGAEGECEGGLRGILDSSTMEPETPSDRRARTQGDEPVSLFQREGSVSGAVVDEAESLSCDGEWRGDSPGVSEASQRVTESWATELFDANACQKVDLPRATNEPALGQ